MLIYRITNKINSKIYVGKTSSTIEKHEHRAAASCWDISKYNSRLYPAIQKYGFENFIFDILEDNLTQDIIDAREQYWIQELNSRDPNIGYNIAPGGNGGALFSGHNHTDEMKLNQSLIQSGKHWYTNGIDEIMVLKDQPIPEGYKLGRLAISQDTIEKIKSSSKKWRQDNKEILSNLSKQGWETRRANGTVQTTGGYKTFTNGQKVVRCLECPEGYIEGNHHTTKDEVNIVLNLDKEYFIELYSKHTLKQISAILNLRQSQCLKLLTRFDVEKHSYQLEAKLAKAYYTEAQLLELHRKRSKAIKESHARETLEQKALRNKHNSEGQKGKTKYINPETGECKVFCPGKVPQGWISKKDLDKCKEN